MLRQIPVYKAGPLPGTSLSKQLHQTPQHFRSLKPSFHHAKESFSMNEISDLFQQEVLYLPELSRMIIENMVTVSELNDILEVYGLFVNSKSKKKIWDALKGHLVGLRHETPARVPTMKMYDFSDLEELFKSEIAYAAENLFVYKNTSKRELDDFLYGKETKKSKRTLWILLKSKSILRTENPKRMNIEELEYMVGTKVVHCEDTLFTYKTVNMDYMRRILIRTGFSTKGDKATLFQRFCKVLNA